MKDDDFLKIIKDVDPNFQEDIVTTGFIDTGCYILNAAVSGSIFGGIANNRVTQLVGDPGSGKSYVAMTVVKTFLAEHENGRAIYFDTEWATDKEFFKNRGIDEKRVVIIRPETLEDFHTKVLNIADGIDKQKPKDRVPVMMVLDSLGNLPSMKELQDAKDGKNVRDMTKQGTIRSIFRTATQRLGRLGIPLIVANHSYQVIGSYIPSKEASGGGGIKFASSSIIFLSKKKDKDGNEVTGNIITFKMDKSRFTRDSIKVETKLSYSKGLHKYYGLLPIAEELEIFKRVGNRYEVPSGLKVYEKEIWKNPETYFTQDVLEKIDAWCQKNFKLGSHDEDDDFELDGVKAVTDITELSTVSDEIEDEIEIEDSEE